MFVGLGRNQTECILNVIGSEYESPWYLDKPEDEEQQ